MSSITTKQVKIACEVTEWYLTHYYGSEHDTGIPRMFGDNEKIGAFAVDLARLSEGCDDTLFKLLVTMTMFQRRSDAQIMRVLRSIATEDAEEITNQAQLLTLKEDVGCEHLQSTESLRKGCDLAKDAKTKEGFCLRNPSLDCHLKRHTTLLKRYGHFGKVPTSAALMIKDNGASSLSGIKEAIWASAKCPQERALLLIKAISKAWRVSDKIGAMFLSAVCNPDLSKQKAPWCDGVDWTQFVVIDSNVDLFLKAIGYKGPWTYAARNKFIRSISKGVPLNSLNKDLHDYNPRLVQQAFYIFMSVLNRAENPQDCHFTIGSCLKCPSSLMEICNYQKQLK